MKGQVDPIVKVFDGNYRLLEIPVYQRNYDWSIRECSRLFDDIEEMLETKRPKHFFGAIVGDPETMNHWIVIDGQQRLTTVSILMLALANAVETGDLEVGKEANVRDIILTDYLHSNARGGDTKFKLKPVKNDDLAYRRLFGPEEDFIETSNLTANYREFYERLTTTKFTASEIWDGICRLEAMILDLEGHDEPQRIFESLNSTGKALSEADKTRNFVLMGLKSQEQTRLYEERWNPIEINVNFNTDWFIRWYLVTKTRKTPKESDVYDTFKAFSASSDMTIQEILDDMFTFSKINRQLDDCKTGFVSVDKQLPRANMVIGDVAKPFLWQVLRDALEGIIDEADLLKIIMIIESYLFRRVFSGVASNALNKIFATLYNDTRKLYTGERPYHELVTYSLRKRDGTSGRFPSDEDFIHALRTRNAYAMRSSYRRYLFDVLENGMSKDFRDISDGLANDVLSIEHIMPQRLTNEWRAMLGPDAEEIHATWLNRLGNLTVTGYNSTFSNFSFTRKKTIEGGFDESPFRLNAGLKDTDVWGPDQMEHRSEELAHRALEYWQLPATDFTPPQAILPQVPMGEDESFRGRVIVGFEFGETREAVSSWAEVTQVVLQIIAQEHRDYLVRVAEEGKTLLEALTREQMPDRDYRAIDNGLVVRLANDTDTKVSFLRGIFEDLKLDPDELVFIFKERDAGKPGDGDGEHQKPHKYADLTKYLPQAEEFAVTLSSPDELDKIIAEFFKSFEPFRVAEHQKVLGSKNVTNFGSVEKASAEEVLALLTLYETMLGVFGVAGLREMVSSGRLSDYLRRLDQLG